MSTTIGTFLLHYSLHWCWLCCENAGRERKVCCEWVLCRSGESSEVGRNHQYACGKFRCQEWRFGLVGGRCGDCGPDGYEVIKLKYPHLRLDTLLHSYSSLRKLIYWRHEKVSLLSWSMIFAPHPPRVKWNRLPNTLLRLTTSNLCTNSCWPSCLFLKEKYKII